VAFFVLTHSICNLLKPIFWRIFGSNFIRGPQFCDQMERQNSILGHQLQNLQTFPVTDISHVGHHHENCCKNVKIAAKELGGLIGY